MSEILSGLVLPEEYRRAGREHIFASPQSLQWFTREHKQELADAGALKLITGRHRIDAAKFDGVVSAVGSRAIDSRAVARQMAEAP